MNRFTLASVFLGLFLLACQTPTSSAAGSALEIGSPAPDFKLSSTTGAEVSLESLKGKVVVLEWFNYGCPFVRKHYDPKHMQALQKNFGEKEVVWLTINSTSSDHRDFRDAEATNDLVAKHGISSTHVLLDPDGTV